MLLALVVPPQAPMSCCRRQRDTGLPENPPADRELDRQRGEAGAGHKRPVLMFSSS